MIYPSERLALLAALGAPVALALGVARPELWALPVAWLALLLVLAAADLALSPGRRTASVELRAPPYAFVGETVPLAVAVRFAGRPPATAEAALTVGDRLSPPAPLRLMPDTPARFDAAARARGPATVGPVDLRWHGPLGLAWRQRRFEGERSVAVAPDVRPVRQEAPRLLRRDAAQGHRLQPDRGESLEFDSLGPWRAGEDKRRIDWKASGRHQALIAKETRVERDNSIVLALDCGRLMTAPVGGLARLDRAITAALLTGYVALKGGDRVGMFGFDARPRAQLPPAPGIRTFAKLQAACGSLDYAEAETNFTLGLSRLGQALTRRTLILLFTDFVDTVQAELMLRAVGPLLKRHRLLCVAFTNDELEAQVAVRPAEPADVTKAAVAADLLRERQIVFERLRRMGVEVVEAPWDRLGPSLVARYLDLKQQGPM